MDEVNVAECLEEDECHGCRRGEAPDGQASLDDAAQSVGEGIMFAELDGDAAQVVGPVVLLVAGYVADVELCAFLELKGAEFHHAVELRAVGDVDALVDSQSCDFPEVGIAVCADGTDAVGAEGKGLRLSFVNLLEPFLALHCRRVFRCE